MYALSEQEPEETEYITRVLENLEFDGTTVLCRVCGDKASGFHYGVHSCEGCKGFFRRSIQQKIQYRPCTKNQQCIIQRVNRNRCQYCRLKKCIAVGMSRDAVRFGRVPKREKARIIAAMHSVQSRSLERTMLSELEDDAVATSAIVDAYMKSCEFSQENIRRLRDQSLSKPLHSYDSEYPSCPLFPTCDSMGEQSSTFSARFSRAIRGVINFSLNLPTFSQIPTDDRMLLLKTGAFEALLVSLARLYESESNTILCMDGRLMRRDMSYSNANSRFLMDSMCEYAERMNALDLSDAELALFTAVVIIAPDRPGIRNKEIIDRINKRISSFLKQMLARNHPNQPNIYRDLLGFIPDLRTLNALHSDKYFCERKMKQNHSPTWEESRLHWDEKERCVNSPSSSCSADEAMRSPESVSGESSGSADGSVCGIEVSTYMELTSPYNRQTRELSEGSSSGDEGLESAGKCPFTKRKKVDSSSDSGFESDKVSLPSRCSSPRSSIDEKIEEDRDEDMPVLRRALQAPPIMNTDLIMEEAYKPHKKFRALRREEEPHSSYSIPQSSSPSLLAQTLSQPMAHSSTQPSSSSLLANALSAPSLAKSLSESPKMSEDSLRRADMIHSLMVKKESLCQRSKKSHSSPRVSPAPFHIPHSVKERLQPPPHGWSSSGSHSGISSSEAIISQPRLHLLTTPSPSRYRDSNSPSVGLGCQPYSNSLSPSSINSYGDRSPSSSNSAVMELQVDISDSQPLNLSKKTPPPPAAFMVEA